MLLLAVVLLLLAARPMRSSTGLEVRMHCHPVTGLLLSLVLVGHDVFPFLTVLFYHASSLHTPGDHVKGATSFRQPRSTEHT